MGRDVLDNEVGQAVSGDLIDRTHDQPVAVSIDEMRVDPRSCKGGKQ